MGYRSDVLIAVAFKDNAHRDEVLAVYRMNPLVQQHDLSAVWTTHDGAYPVLWYYEESTKWYDSFEDVQGIEHLLNVVSDFAEERKLHYAAVHYRIGEDINDTETAEHGEADPDGSMLSCLFDMCGLERRLTHNFN